MRKTSMGTLSKTPQQDQRGRETAPEESAVEAVLRFQGLGYVRPLTCRYCEEREDLLRPEEREGQVVLFCPTCRSEQVMEPDFLDLVVQMSRLPNRLEALPPIPAEE